MTRTPLASTAARAAAGSAARRFAPLALTLLAACAGAQSGGTTVYSPFIETRYSALEVSSVGPAMPLEVHGTPPDGSTPEEVAAAIRLPAMFAGRPTVLVPPGGEGRRLVLAFSPSTRLHLCERPGTTGAQRADGLLEAAMAFCLAEFEMTSASVRSGATAGPRDDGFTRAMLQTLHVVLPPRNPLIDHGFRPRMPGF